MGSLWSEDVQLPSFAPLKGDIRTDVLIIGGGMAGVLCARMLQDAGIDYILAEADRVGSGITKNTTAKITSQHGLIYHKIMKRYGTEPARMYLDANEQAVAAYRRLCETIDCDYSREDSFVYSTDDRAKLEKELYALQRLGYSAELAEDVPLPFRTVGAVKFKNQGQFHPMKFLSAIGKDLNIFEHTRIHTLAPGTAVTDQGTIKAEKIIVATHFPMLNKHGSYFLKLYQHRSYVLALENVPPVRGMYISESMTGLSFRGHNGLLLLGGGSHRTGKSGGNWRELEAFAQANYLGASLKARWATQDCMSLDGIPYIGPYSKNTPDLYVATGFNKWGMTSAMAAARILTDMVTGKENPWAEVFSPSRTMLHPQLALNALETTVNLLTPTIPRCPHLGCALKWNPRERTWDCPCHGSRFEENGQLIDNPATGDMKKRD